MIKLRPEVQRFAEAMEEKLQENDWKGGWEGCSVGFLFSQLREATNKAEIRAQALAPVPSGTLLRDCADIANYAMMIGIRSVGFPIKEDEDEQVRN